MIEPAHDVIFVRFDNGRAEPLALEELAARILENEGPKVVEEWIAEQIASAIFHYLHAELKRDWISSKELFWILRAAVDGLAQAKGTHPQLFSMQVHRVIETDLHELALASGRGFELEFFGRLTRIVSEIERQEASVIRLTGLRPCVKTVIGAQHWSPRCDRMTDEILGYVRGRLGQARKEKTSLLMIL